MTFLPITHFFTHLLKNGSFIGYQTAKYLRMHNNLKVLLCSQAFLLSLLSEIGCLYSLSLGKIGSFLGTKKLLQQWSKPEKKTRPLNHIINLLITRTYLGEQQPKMHGQNEACDWLKTGLKKREKSFIHANFLHNFFSSHWPISFFSPIFYPSKSFFTLDWTNQIRESVSSAYLFRAGILKWVETINFKVKIFKCLEPRPE